MKIFIDPFYKVLIFTFTVFSNVTFANNKCNNYYTYINKAENLIIENNLVNALSYYDSAFRISNKAIDLYNASCCSLYLSRYNLAYKYLSVYFNKGSKYYLDFPSFQKYFPKVSSIVYDSINKMKERGKKIQLQYFLDSVYTIDQFYHGKRRDSMWYYDRKNHELLFDHIRKNTFNFETDSTISYNNEKSLYPKYEVLFIHLFQASLIDSADIKVLKNEVCNGNISPVVFASWWDYYVNYDQLGTKNIWLYFPQTDTSLGDYYNLHINRGSLFFGFDNYSLEKQSKMNRDRLEMNLETIEKLKKKIEYKLMFKSPYFLQTPNVQIDYK